MTSSVNEADQESAEGTLSSCVSTSPADALLRRAIATALDADASDRAALFARLLGEIEAFMKSRSDERPWTFETFDGTDGSRIFRGQTGRSIVVDPAGTMWKARSYEDFQTEYLIVGSTCSVVSVTPRYESMRRYSPGGLVEPLEE